MLPHVFSGREAAQRYFWLCCTFFLFISVHVVYNEYDLIFFHAEERLKQDVPYCVGMLCVHTGQEQCVPYDTPPRLLFSGINRRWGVSGHHLFGPKKHPGYYVA